MPVSYTHLKLLKDMYMNPSLKGTLDVWDIQLVEFGKKIIERRAAFVDQMNTIIGGIHDSLSGGKEKLLLSYELDISPEDFEGRLRAARKGISV